jgi:hypothetical protein
MHQVLVALLPLEDLMDVFSRIFSHLDSQVPKLFFSADSDENISFSLPVTMEGKRQMILEVESMARILNDLTNVRPWDFGAVKFIARRLEVEVSSDGCTDITIPIITVNGEDAEMHEAQVQTNSNNVKDEVENIHNETFQNDVVSDESCTTSAIDTNGLDPYTATIFPQEESFQLAKDTVLWSSDTAIKSMENKEEELTFDNSLEQTEQHSKLDEEKNVIAYDEEEIPVQE